MGPKTSKLENRRKEFKELKKNTKYCNWEIRAWHREFTKACPSGYLSKEYFKVLFFDLFPFGDGGEVAEYLYQSFDTNGDGVIDFRELLCALSVMSRGQPEEKLKLTFSMCDLDGNGYITRQEMIKIISALYKVRSTDLPQGIDTPEEKTNKIFDKMDSDHDGKLSLEEFIEGAKSDPFFCDMMEDDFDS